jgi:WD40 repeat protein
MFWKFSATPTSRELDLRLPEPRLWTVAPDAAWIALSDPRPNNKRVRVVEGDSGSMRFARNFDETVGCLASSPDGRVLAIGLNDTGRGANSKVVLFDAATGERFSTLPTQRKGMTTMTFSADGRFLAVGFHGLIHIWDTQSREIVRSIAGFERIVTCLNFSRDGKLLAGGTQDGQVWIWSVTRGVPNQRIEVGSRGVRTVAFSPDGLRLVVVANIAPVGLWEVAEPVSNGESE